MSRICFLSTKTNNKCIGYRLRRENICALHTVCNRNNYVNDLVYKKKQQHLDSSHKYYPTNIMREGSFKIHHKYHIASNNPKSDKVINSSFFESLPETLLAVWIFQKVMEGLDLDLLLRTQTLIAHERMSCLAWNQTKEHLIILYNLKTSFSFIWTWIRDENYNDFFVMSNM